MILSFPPKRLAGSYVPETNDDKVVMPPVLMPVTEMPGLLGVFISGSGFVAFNGPLIEESGYITIERTQPASSALAQVGICNLNKGLFRIKAWGSSFQNFTSAVQITLVSLSNTPGTASVELLNFYAAANVPVIHPMIDLLINFGQDFNSIDLQQGATGVGQTIQTAVNLFVTRLA